MTMVFIASILSQILDTQIQKPEQTITKGFSGITTIYHQYTDL